MTCVSQSLSPLYLAEMVPEIWLLEKLVGYKTALKYEHINWQKKLYIRETVDKYEKHKKSGK